jgi:hypothetical protein
MKIRVLAAIMLIAILILAGCRPVAIESATTTGKTGTTGELEPINPLRLKKK